METLEKIITGNYSFWILLTGLAQLVVMIVANCRRKK